MQRGRIHIAGGHLKLRTAWTLQLDYQRTLARKVRFETPNQSCNRTAGDETKDEYTWSNRFSSLSRNSGGFDVTSSDTGTGQIAFEVACELR